MDFWARQLGVEAPQPSQPVKRAWWQEEPQRVYDRGIPRQGYQPEAVAPQNDEVMFRQLQRVPASELTQEQMEFMAEHELGRAKYNQSCPQCGSSNFIPAGTKTGTQIMPTDKCFDCGASARSPEPALGGRGRASGVPSSVTRQIDTGGSGGSMYMKFNSVPVSYRPRS